MKNNIKWLIAAAAFIVLILGVSLLYNRLKSSYGNDNLAADTQGETQSTEDSRPAQQAPDFTVLDFEGNEVKLSDYYGKPIVLNFWATWCYYCKEEMPDFNKAYEKYPDVQFFMVNATDGVQETEEKAKAYLEKQGFAFPVFFDTKGEAVNAYYVTGFPASYFIDKDGNLIAHGSGMLDFETLEKGIAMITD